MRETLSWWLTENWRKKSRRHFPGFQTSCPEGSRETRIWERPVLGQREWAWFGRLKVSVLTSGRFSERWLEIWVKLVSLKKKKVESSLGKSSELRCMLNYLCSPWGSGWGSWRESREESRTQQFFLRCPKWRCLLPFWSLDWTSLKEGVTSKKFLHLFPPDRAGFSPSCKRRWDPTFENVFWIQRL